MGHIVYDDDVETLELEGERYDLKCRMSWRDRRMLEAEMINLASKIKEGSDIGLAKPLLLMLNIKGWSLKDRSEQPLPITEENIDRLDGRIAMLLCQEIDRRNPPPKA